MGSFGLAARRSSASCTGGLTRGTLLTGSRRKGSVSIPCGPTNNCIGIGDVLRRRGHRVVFAAEASWQDRLEPLGFAEDLVNLAPPLTESTKSEVSTTAGSAVSTEDDAADAGQFWKAFIRDTAPEFRKPTI